MKQSKFKISKIVNKEFEESNINLDTLFRYSVRSMFKTPVNIRSKMVGDFRYIGYDTIFYKSKKKNVFTIALLYKIKGAKHKLPYKNEYLRLDYYLIFEIPFKYFLNKKNFNKLRYSKETKIKLYSSDFSFLYWGFAYALNKLYKGLFLESNKIKQVLKHYYLIYPKHRNPNLKIELTKHYYKLFTHIKYEKIRNLLDKKKYLYNKIDYIDIPTLEEYKLMLKGKTLTQIRAKQRDKIKNKKVKKIKRNKKR